MKKVYLAIPYSGITEVSHEVANHVASKLMAEGYIVYSPISHNHVIAKAHSLPTGWDFWLAQDEAFVAWADEVHVINIQHFGGNDYNGKLLIEKSVGVQAEIKIGQGDGKPIIYIDYDSRT